ncbi:MAG: low molecular weight protein-tyrosine-phosphatase [Phocaeicola sp.]|uniref:low molecular weight protein-tyrosine-phosphatase n=1 Tax=Phocaeicola TaxID=909656 RepID=UPI00234E4562|nr:low molecular weight protein-tyrosine-phosphatase [Phocaeicola oris]MCE2617393.1 low molecular weight phosphotyrosine protein phosphatase [Phocaeicola oris]
MNGTKKEIKRLAILFICLGNICRSPAAEGIMKTLVNKARLGNHFYIDSAGIGRWHVGQLPDSRMRAHGERRGYSFNHHCRQFTTYDFAAFDYIIVMDEDNYEAIADKARNKEELDKIHYMTEYLLNFKEYHRVPDPYYEGAEGFELVLDLLEDSCAGLLEKCKEELRQCQ